MLIGDSLQAVPLNPLLSVETGMPLQSLEGLFCRSFPQKTGKEPHMLPQYPEQQVWKGAI